MWGKAGASSLSGSDGFDGGGVWRGFGPRRISGAYASRVSSVPGADSVDDRD